MRRLSLFFLGIFLFLLFLLFTYAVGKDAFTQFDFDTTVRIQDHVSDWWSTFFSYFSLLGSAEVTMLLFLIVTFFPSDVWRKLLLLPAYFFVFLIGILGKTLILHPGPTFMFYHYKLSFLFPSSYIATGNSYPSGHASRTIFLTAILLILILRGGKITPTRLLLIAFILLFDCTMLVSRVYLGEHWTSDVIGGSLLGGSLALTAGAFLLKREKSG